MSTWVVGTFDVGWTVAVGKVGVAVGVPVGVVVAGCDAVGDVKVGLGKVIDGIVGLILQPLISNAAIIRRAKIKATQFSLFML